MRRLLRVVLWLLAVLVALPVVLVAGGLLYLNSGAGRALLEGQAASLLPGLRIEGLQGPLPGHLALARLSYADAEGPWLRLEGARVDLDVWALPRGVLRIAAVEAQRVEVARLPATAPGEPAPPSDRVLPQLPHLPLALQLDRLAVGELALGEAVLGQALRAGIEGEARLADGALAARLAVQRQDAPGALRLDASLAASEQLRAQLVAEEPPGGVVATLLRQAAQPFSLSLSLDGPASGARLHLHASLGPEIGAEIGGTVSATPQGAMAAALNADLRAAPLLPAEIAGIAMPLRLETEVALSAQSLLSLRRLQLHGPFGEAQASGTLSLAQDEAVAMQLGLRLAASAGFGPLLSAGLHWDTLQLNAHASGSLPRPRLVAELLPRGLGTGQAPLDAALGVMPRLTATLAWPEQRLRLQLQGQEAELVLDGDAGEQLDLRARLDVPRLAALGQGMDGALQLQAQAQGPRGDPTLRLQASADRIAADGQVLQGLRATALVQTPLSAPRVAADASGQWQDLPLRLAVNGQPEGSLLRLQQAEASLGPARLVAEGVIDPQAALMEGVVSLQVPELAPLGRLAGAALGGRLTAEAMLRRATDGSQGFTARLQVPALSYNGTAGSADLSAEGSANGFDFRAEAQGAGAALRGNGSLATTPEGRLLRLAALEARGMGETLRLAAPAQIRLGADGGIGLGDIALATGRGGQLRASGRWGPEQADVTATLNALPLALAEAVAPGLDLRGTLSGDVRATGAVAQPAIRARLQAAGVQSGAAWAQGLPALGLRAEATLQGQAAEARAEFEAGAAGRLVATARLPQGFGAAAPLQASVDGTLEVAPLAQPFLAAGADRVTGRVAVALRAEGRVGAPQFGGRATIAGGSYRNSTTGVALTGIAGAVVGDGTRLRIDNLVARTGGNGSITLAGDVDVGAAGFPAALRLLARNARPVVSDLVNTSIDADLRLTGPLLGAARLEGEVTLPRTELQVPERLPASSPQLENVRLRGTPPPGSAAAIAQQRAAARAARGGNAGDASGIPPIALAVKVHAPRVFVRGRGLDVELGGDVDVGGTAAAPVAQGGLTLRRGSLDVLARRLSFDRGTITLERGNFVPQLDLTATSRAQSTAITLKVTGAANAPQIAFTSAPELPQDEILARLLFDRSTSKLSPFEIAQIAEAIGQLTGAPTGSNALGRVRTALGLDRLGVGSNSAGNAQLEAGRYVAPGVFLGVRQGTTGQTGVGVQVEITPRLRLEGQTATGPAGDRVGLSYEFEY